MTATLVAQTIQLVLAPVVMITACAIVLNALQSRYAALNDRLRAMAHERLDLLRNLERSQDGGSPADRFATERLGEIDTQAPDLLRRHLLLHNAVQAAYAAIVTFIISMFLIATAELTGLALAATGALVVFLAGTILLLVGVVQTVLEVHDSHRALHYEVHRILDLRQRG